MPQSSGNRRGGIRGRLLLLASIAATIAYLSLHRSLLPFVASFDDGRSSLWRPPNATAAADSSGGGGRRSAYGYRRPRPPFEPVRHVSHDCTVPSASGRYSRKVHIPVAVPHLILIGAQKSGTTSLQIALSRREDVVKPVRRRTFEAHFFDWDLKIAKDMERQVFNESSEVVLCKYREEYADFWDADALSSSGGRGVAFEKTPSYMVYPAIPAAIDAVCPWKPKILVVLRNPVDRAWSQYQMDRGKGNNRGTRKAFYGMVNNEMLRFQRHGILEGALTVEEHERSGGSVPPFRFPPNMTLHDYAHLIRTYPEERIRSPLFRGLYAPLLLFWVHRFAIDDRLMVVRFEDFIREDANGGKNGTIMKDVLGFAGLVVDRRNSDEEGGGGNETRYRNASHHVRRIGGVGGSPVLTHRDGGKYEPMPPRIRHYLTLFYRPFNEHLADLLGEEWRGIWD